MALYRAILAPLWPNKTLRMLLIWTEGPLAVSLPAGRLDAALATFAAGDGCSLNCTAAWGGTFPHT
jgi:ATP-dependent helicase/nuclease subunit A